jgi:DNA-binding transcriptional ArsR family regulator
MGITKTDFFSEEQNDIATMFKAIGHPARVAILDYLLKVNACITGDIVNELPLAQPTISQHLKELKNAGLIKGAIDGNAICYCIVTVLMIKGIEKLQSYFGNILSTLNSRKGCCE